MGIKCSKVFKLFKSIKIMKPKKSQVAFLIIMAIAVLILFTFNYSQETEIITTQIDEDEGSDVTKQDTLKIINLNNNVYKCLDDVMDQSLIIAGLQGGYILDYDNNDNFTYLEGSNYYYNANFINSVDVSLNDLQTLIYLKDELRTPRINGTQYYGVSIKEDMENFIFNESKKCFNFTEFDNSGFEIENFSSKPILNLSFNENNVVLNYEYPLVLFNNNSNTRVSFDRVSVKKDIRFKPMLKIASHILMDKNSNKSLNMTDPVVLNKTLSRLGGYNINNFKLYKENIVNEPDRKVYKYTLLDKCL